MWNWIIDKFTTFIAYLCLPITYPMYIYQMRNMNKRIEMDRKNREKINRRVNLRK